MGWRRRHPQGSQGLKQGRGGKGGFSQLQSLMSFIKVDLANSSILLRSDMFPLIKKGELDTNSITFWPRVPGTYVR